MSVTRQFTQSPQRVFDAWLDPAKAGKFLFATPNGEMVRVEIEPRVGGAFCCVDRRDGEDVEHFGHYLQIERPRRLAFDFTVSLMPEAKTQVSIEIRPVKHWLRTDAPVRKRAAGLCGPHQKRLGSHPRWTRRGSEGVVLQRRRTRPSHPDNWEASSLLMPMNWSTSGHDR